ncbi:MRG domain-containing protein [Ditylenchus destructor]|nr:MRG domain-containing protein [Ditylenchus destructor]
MKQETKRKHSASPKFSCNNPRSQPTRITQLKLPRDLQEILHEENKLVRDYFLSSLPARVTVREILIEYLKSIANYTDSDRAFCRKFLALFDSSVEKIIVDLERPMFHDFLQGELFYYGHKQQRPEYLENVGIRKERDESIRASSAFGLVHLLRFLRDIHEFVKIQNWSNDYTKDFMERTKKLVKFLHEWDGYFDAKDDVYPVTIDYFKRVMEYTPKIYTIQKKSIA